MTYTTRRFLFHAAGLVAAVVVFGLLDSAGARAVAAVAGLGVVVLHGARSDEVERALVLRAAATSFAVVAAGAVGVAVLGLGAWLTGLAEVMWAVFFGLYMVSWVVWRVVRG